MAKKLNIENVNEISTEELFTNKSLEKAVTEELAAHGKKSMFLIMYFTLCNTYCIILFCGYRFFFLDKLERFEIPTAIYLCTDVWTPDNNLVTAAFKLKRREIYDKYKTQIDKLYKS